MRSLPIAVCVLALAATARAFDEPAAPAWQVQQLQEDLRQAREEIAKLRAEQAEQHKMIQAILDADPALKEKVRQHLKEQEDASKKAEQDARTAAAVEEMSATTIAGLSADGFQFVTYAGKVYEVTRNSALVAKWPVGTRFALGVERYKRGADGQAWDALWSTTPIPISVQGGDAVLVKFDLQATIVIGEIIRLNRSKAAGEKIDEARLASLYKDPKVKKLYEGRNAGQ